MKKEHFMSMPEYSPGHGATPAPGGSVLLFVAPFLIGLQILFSVITYVLLPATVPSHWNAAGQVDSYMPKLGFILVFLGISIGIYVVLQLIRALTALDNDPQKRRVATLILSCVSIFVVVVGLVIQIITTGVILHWL
jgi:uncharacterized membrane protein